MNRSRRPLIAGNWKMHHGGKTSCPLAAAVARVAAEHPQVDVLVAPPFTAIAAVAHELDGSRVAVAAQNVHQKAQGAFTGEVSSSMLLEAGATWVIIGHSERRHLFGETDAGVADKTRASLEAGLRPIVCVGETLAERQAGKTVEVVLRQLDAVMASIEAAPGKVVIAYEPVWAIGTGLNAVPAQIDEAHEAIRARIAERSREAADATLVLYGGSVKPDNIDSILRCPHVDGALVGGASLDPAQFAPLIEAASSLASSPTVGQA